MMRGRDNRGPETDRWERKDWWQVTLGSAAPFAFATCLTALAAGATLALSRRRR